MTSHKGSLPNMVKSHHRYNVLIPKTTLVWAYLLKGITVRGLHATYGEVQTAREQRVKIPRRQADGASTKIVSYVLVLKWLDSFTWKA